MAPNPSDGPIMTEELRKVLLALSSNQAKHKSFLPKPYFTSFGRLFHVFVVINSKMLMSFFVICLIVCTQNCYVFYPET